MGCDIHTYVEQRQSDGRWACAEWPSLRDYSTGPFDHRHYGMFGFFADVRNSSAVPPLAEPRGLPDGTSPEVLREFESWGFDAHTPSWLAVDQLAAFDYDQTFEDRRVTRRLASGVLHGAATAEPGGGQQVTYREFLGDWFFEDLDQLRKMNDQAPTRVVFWFDN